MSQSDSAVDTSAVLPLLPLRGAVLFPGVVASFDWPSDNSALAYVQDRLFTPRKDDWETRAVTAAKRFPCESLADHLFAMRDEQGQDLAHDADVFRRLNPKVIVVDRFGRWGHG
jgi:hypothetical protein